jgi:hypothetical protein
MPEGTEGAIAAAKRLLVDATEFTENERAERNVESAIELLEAAGESSGRDAEQRAEPGAITADE